MNLRIHFLHCRVWLSFYRRRYDRILSMMGHSLVLRIPSKNHMIPSLSMLLKQKQVRHMMGLFDRMLHKILSKNVLQVEQTRHSLI